MYAFLNKYRLVGENGDTTQNQNSIPIGKSITDIQLPSYIKTGSNEVKDHTERLFSTPIHPDISQVVLNDGATPDITPEKHTFYTICYNIGLFSIAAVPMFSVFAAHECASIGHFLSETLPCGSGGVQFSPISPVWSHIFLILYYYCLTKYCAFIEA